MARLLIGEVLLATRIGDVLGKLPVAIMPGNPSLSHQLTEGQPFHLCKLGSLAQRQGALCIERQGKLRPQPLGNLPFGNAEALEHGVRDMQRHPHDHTIPLCARQRQGTVFYNAG